MPFYGLIIAYFRDYVKSEYLHVRETGKVLRLGIFFVFVRADRTKLCADIRAMTANPRFALIKTEYKQQDKDTKVPE